MKTSRHFLLPIFTLLLLATTSITAVGQPSRQPVLPADPLPLVCTAPDFLSPGDTVALISPSYFTPTENVEITAELVRGWGYVPVIGPHVGLTFAGKYAGTLEERLTDLRWALHEPSVKAILCNRGGYGTIHLIDHLSADELRAHPKWMVGFSDITTLHEMWSCAGLMSIHGVMSSTLAKKRDDATCHLMRGILGGDIPDYVLPAHPQNIPGSAEGTLVGGNLCTFVPNLDTWADATAHDGIILFMEEVEETYHNIDRLFTMLRLRGVLDHCRGVIFGEFTDCPADLDYESVEAMLRPYLEPYGIPLACGFPAGHDRVNLPLVMGSRVTMDVSETGARISFGIDGRHHEVSTERALIEARPDTLAQ